MVCFIFIIFFCTIMLKTKQLKIKRNLGLKSTPNYQSISTTPLSKIKQRAIAKSSIIGVLFNFVNITVGIGVLGLPYAIKNTGMLTCIISLLLFGVVCTYTLNILIISAEKVSVYHYEKLTEYCFGSLGYIYTSFCIFVMIFGSLVAQLIAIGDAATLLLLIFYSTNNNYSTTIANNSAMKYERQIMIFGIAVCFILPFCLFRDLSSLSKMSAIKIYALLFIIIVVGYEFYASFYPTNVPSVSASNQPSTVPKSDMNEKSDAMGNDLEINWFLTIDGLPSTLGIIAFTFLCHDCTFLMYNTLKNSNVRRWKIVTFWGIFITISFNLIFSVLAYLTFGIHSQSNIINNYPIANVLIIIVRITIIGIMILSYPPCFLIARHIAYESYYEMICYVSKYVQKLRVFKLQHEIHAQPVQIQTQHALIPFSPTRNLRNIMSPVNISMRINAMNEEEYRYDDRTDEQECHSVQTAPICSYLAFTFFVFFASVIVALFVDNLGMVMALIGSLSAVNLEFVLPAMCYLKIFLETNEDYSDEWGWMEKFYWMCKQKMDVLIPIILVIFGLGMMVTGVLSSLNAMS